LKTVLFRNPIRSWSVNPSSFPKRSGFLVFANDLRYFPYAKRRVDARTHEGTRARIIIIKRTEETTNVFGTAAAAARHGVRYYCCYNRGRGRCRCRHRYTGGFELPSAHGSPRRVTPCNTGCVTYTEFKLIFIR